MAFPDSVLILNLEFISDLVVSIVKFLAFED